MPNITYFWNNVWIVRPLFNIEKKELIEYLLDNTSSKDVIYYANELGDFEIPDHTISEIERAISDYSEEEKFSFSTKKTSHKRCLRMVFKAERFPSAESETP